MTDTQQRLPMGLEQKKRCANASREALAWRERLNIARITDAPEAKLEEFETELERSEARFEWLLNTRGLRKGDIVRITEPGPHLDAEVRIKDFEKAGTVLQADVDDITVMYTTYQIELVKAKRG